MDLEKTNEFRQILRCLGPDPLRGILLDDMYDDFIFL